MTAIRIARPVVELSRIRQVDGRWVGVLLAGTMLAVIGGLPLVELVAMMVAQVLFIAFTVASLITLFVVGLALARRAVDST